MFAEGVDASADVQLAGDERVETSDRQLADAIAAGDQAAFRALVRRCHSLLYRTARGIVKDDCEAEDVVQNAYLRGYRGMGKFRGESSLATWLARIAMNEARGRLRQRSRSPNTVHLDGAEPDAAVGRDPDGTNANIEHPEELMIRSETRRVIQARIDELPLAYRAVFVLRAVDECSVREAADALDIPEATVRSRFFRARAQLRQSLSAVADGAPGTLRAPASP